MATYNGAQYIHRQIASILAQLHSEDELIISDDSSQDGTLAIIRSFEDPRIRLHPGQTFRSPVYNFEHALSEATGEIIFLADQDDVWLAGRVDRALEVLKRVHLVACDALLVDRGEQPLHSTLSSIYPFQTGLIRNFVRNSYTGCCMAFRKEVLAAALPFPARLPWHDWWIGLLAEALFSTTFLREPLLLYRRHETNASPTGGKSPYGLRHAMETRMRLLLPLLRRVVSRVWNRSRP